MEDNLQSTRHPAVKQETSQKLASLQSEQAPQFIEEQFTNLNWDVINKRFENALK